MQRQNVINKCEWKTKLNWTILRMFLFSGEAVVHSSQFWTADRDKGE